MSKQSFIALALPVATGALLLGLTLSAVAGSESPAPQSGEAIQGRIVHVDDGDTVVLLTSTKEQIKIRLASIDAPESSHTNKERGRIGQPFNVNATRFLEQMVKGANVEARCVDTDRYGRRVCFLLTGAANVNTELVRSGWAWANMASGGRYLRDRNLLQIQEEARAARRGLWAGSQPVPPWEWRKTCWEGGVCPQ